MNAPDLSAYDLTRFNGPIPRPEKRKRTPRPEDAEMRGLFRRIVCSEPCLKHGFAGDCDGPLQAAHVVPKQTLRRRGRHDLVWDPENGVCLCESAHRRHDLGVEKIPRSWLPKRSIEWAARHGLEDALERHWPKGPGRTQRRKLTERFTAPCALCGGEPGTPYQIVPHGSFTANNLVSLGAACRELLGRRHPTAVAALRELIHNERNVALYVEGYLGVGWWEIIPVGLEEA